MKACSVCKATKGAHEFARQTASPDGLTYRCKACIAAYNRAYAAANAEAAVARARAWRAANPEKAKAQAKEGGRARRATKQDTIRERQREHRLANKPLYAAKTRRRDAAKAKATLPCSGEGLLAVYERAALLTIVTGVEHHVDHIVPLKGRQVCGLHVPWNLQCLPARENISKGNRF